MALGAFCLLIAKDKRFKFVLTLFAAVFKNRHGVLLTGKRWAQSPFKIKTSDCANRSFTDLNPFVRSPPSARGRTSPDPGQLLPAQKNQDSCGRKPPH